MQDLCSHKQDLEALTTQYKALQASQEEKDAGFRSERNSNEAAISQLTHILESTRTDLEGAQRKIEGLQTERVLHAAEQQELLIARESIKAL